MLREECNARVRRGQFALGPAYLAGRETWQRVTVGTLRLTAHPDLSIRQVVRDRHSLTLVGFLLDPSHPAREEQDILAALLHAFARGTPFASWVRLTYALAGRWILIADDGVDPRLFADAMGLRQAYYLAGEAWCATDPGLIAAQRGLSFDPAAQAGYIDAPAYQRAEQPLWPGDATPYPGVRHLLANHVLDVRAGRASRYWPDQPLGRLDIDDAADRAAGLLRGAIDAAIRRRPLCFGLSAGWDSRVLLAAARPWADRIHFYSYTYSRPSVDPVVGKGMLTALGLQHHEVPVPDVMDDDFGAYFSRHATLARPYVGRFVQAMFDGLPSDRLNITGNAAEIVRTRFRLATGESLTARWLSGLTTFHREEGFEGLPFAVDAWQRWLDELGDRHDVNALDVFYWEHFAGNFAGADQADVDFAIDTFTPYNCRELLTTMLAVPEESRDHDYPQLYVEIIRRGWPRVLEFPVNPARAAVFQPDGSTRLPPSGWRQQLRSTAVDALVASRLYTPMRKLRRRVGR